MTIRARAPNSVVSMRMTPNAEAAPMIMTAMTRPTAGDERLKPIIDMNMVASVTKSNTPKSSVVPYVPSSK